MKKFIQYPNPDAIDLLDSILKINPKKRLTAKQALSHNYFKEIRDLDEEIDFAGEIDFQFEMDEKITYDQLKKMILEEVNLIRAEQHEEMINVEQETKRLQQIAQSNRAKRKQLS